MKVVELMTRHPGACEPTNSLDEVASLLQQHDCGALPVVESAGAGSVIGMITDRDVCMAALREGKALAEIHVQDAMTQGAATVHPDDDVEEAAHRMREGRVRRLPVVDGGGALVGMLSLGDLAQAGEDVRPGLVSETLTAVSIPTAASNDLPVS